MSKSYFYRKYRELQKVVVVLSKSYFLRFKATEHTFMVIIAVAIGLIGGFGAVGIQFAIKAFQKIFWGDWNFAVEYARSLPWTHKLLAPAAGALLVGLIVHYVAREAKGHGVPEVMEAIALRNGVIRPRVVVAKLFASAICIGSGGSVGREGPVIQIGSSIGSTVGQFLQVNTQRMKTFVACGAAAGIAAAFNAPVAGALFSVEIILGDFAVAQFSPIVISSVVATVVSRHFLGDFPAFMVPKYNLVSPFELIPYAGLGILAGFVALLFINTLYKTEQLFDKMGIAIYVKTVFGGLVIGAVGIFIPHIYGVGYHTIDTALRGDLLWQWLLLLIVVKVFATSISLGSGGSGGVFAPSLFLGAMTGGFFGEFVHQFFPASTASSGAYALVGMGAVVAAATHAPITAILIIFELTNDYKIILPLMISCIIATLLSTKLQKESIYTIKHLRRGINIFKGREMNVLRSIKVSEVMQTDIEMIPENMPFREFMKVMLDSPQSQFFVRSKSGDFKGMISFSQVRDVLRDEKHLSNLLVAHDLMTTIVPVVLENDTLDNAMKVFGSYDTEALPVVANHGSRRLVGKLSRKDVIEAYNEEITKRDVTSELARSVRFLEQAKTLDFVNGYALAEIACPKEFVGKSLRDLNLRARFNVQVILVKRPGPRDKETSLVPVPAEVFRAEDTLVIVGPEKNIESLRNY